MTVGACLLAVGAGIVLYTMAGYPAILAFLTRRRRPPVRTDPAFHPSVSTLLAVHNGEQFLRAKLESLLALDYPGGLLDILVISDGSTDATDSIAEEFACRGVRLLRESRGGKAAALNLGLQHATGEILFFTDVRQALDPSALRRLVENFADPTVGVVSGELRLIRPERTGEQADMELYWRYELWARNRHSQIDSVFNTTGCIYAIRRSLAAPIPVDTLSDDAVMPLRAFFQGYRVILEPAAVAFDYPAAEGHEFRRRLRTLAGLWQVHSRVPQLFTGGNRMRFHFLSHKFTRLLLPWGVLLAVAGTIALPASSWRTFFLLAEAAGAALALFDPLIPKWLPLKRISSPARTFLVMNVAALLALAVFVVPPQRFWRPASIKVR
jgi:cellulose synthase/poly-beta-1,6-N-acetylglucosamine synthase-like glycosyltransferase